MRQEINFFRGLSRPSALPFGARWTLSACLAMLAALAVATGAQWVSHRNLEARMMDASRQAEDLESLVKSLQLRFPEPRVDPGLLAEAERLQRHADALERLLNGVEEGEFSRRGGFSDYFQALARQTVAGVWLTAIRVTAGGTDLELQGRALQAEDIPILVEALGQEKVFKAKAFSQLTITRPEQEPGQVEFMLRTSIPAGDDKG